MRYGLSISPAGEARDTPHIRSLAAAGVSLWTEWVMPGNLARVTEAVQRGPMRGD
jgi:hypothetical protein